MKKQFDIEDFNQEIRRKTPIDDGAMRRNMRDPKSYEMRLNLSQRIKGHMNKPLTDDQAMLYMIFALGGVMILFLAVVIALTAFGVIK